MKLAWASGATLGTHQSRAQGCGTPIRRIPPTCRAERLRVPLQEAFQALGSPAAGLEQVGTQVGIQEMETAEELVNNCCLIRGLWSLPKATSSEGQFPSVLPLGTPTPTKAPGFSGPQTFLEKELGS